MEVVVDKTVKCKKSIFKSTYNGDAVTDGKTYTVYAETRHFVWINDNDDRQFSFVRKASLKLHPSCPVYEDYFEVE